jgi:hypothetical protein
VEIRLHPDAEQEFLHELQYYDSISEGLGSKFFNNIDAAFEGIRSTPHLAHNRGDGIYSIRVNHFPFSIFYRVVNKK